MIYSKVKKFILGFFFTFVLVYVFLFLITCGYYGFSGIIFILIFSIYAHVTLLPFLIYSIGGFIFISIPDAVFAKYNLMLWKWIMIGCVICFGIICLSELAHHLGFLTAQYKLNWQ